MSARQRLRNLCVVYVDEDEVLQRPDLMSATIAYLDALVVEMRYDMPRMQQAWLVYSPQLPRVEQGRVIPEYRFEIQTTNGFVPEFVGARFVKEDGMRRAA